MKLRWIDKLVVPELEPKDWNTFGEFMGGQMQLLLEFNNKRQLNYFD